MAYPDLTDLDAVRQHLTISNAQTAKDELLSALISRASLAIMEFAQREFVSEASGSTTRTFVYHGGGYLDLAPYDLRSVTQIRIDTDGANPSPTTLTADDYRFVPRPARHGVYTGLQLRNLSPGAWGSSTDYRPEREVQVTSATWGFATVPEAVEEAAILTVAHLYRHFGQAYSVSDIGDGLDLSSDGRRLMPFAAVELVRPYRRLSL